jgi:riboflavin kinase/FMN adenylyltransferase
MEQIPEISGDTSIAIGNFDGMHLGHHEVLRFLCVESRRKNTMSVVLTFHPHPKSVLGQSPVPLIQTLDQRLEEMGKHDIHTVMVLPFDSRMAEMSARAFVTDLLLDKLHGKEIIVGENFFFGHKRRGSVPFLKEMGSRFGFKVFSCSPVEKDGAGISSSTIRTLLVSGRIEEANLLLGRAYSIDGTIIEGKSQGRRLGFPTANIQTPNEILPRGVHITCARCNGRKLPAITNIGSRPTFGEGNPPTIESFLIDFEGDIYGRGIRLHFLKKLREEIRFPSPEELSGQIRRDLETARRFFAGHPLSSLC